MFKMCNPENKRANAVRQRGNIKFKIRFVVTLVAITSGYRH